MTSSSPPATCIAATLREEFHAHYGSGRDFEGVDLIRFAIAAGRFLGEIVGADVAAKGMAEMARSLDLQCGEDNDWEHAFESGFGDAYCWPLGEVFHDLNAYAHYGIALNGGADPEARAAQIAETLERGESFMARLPEEAWQLDAGDAGHTLRLARGRWALDNNKSIEPYALAAFGNVTERRIRNMMAGKESMLSNDEGKVPAREALHWLSSRQSFRPSVWREQDMFDDLAPRATEVLPDPLFVPIARDGSRFHPGLRRDDGYTIGSPGNETVIASYDEALAALQHSALPAWRRPSPLGSWTSVTAVRWDRLARSELEDVAAGETS